MKHKDSLFKIWFTIGLGHLNIAILACFVKFFMNLLYCRLQLNTIYLNECLLFYRNFQEVPNQLFTVVE